MKTHKMKFAALLVSLCMISSLALVGCEQVQEVADDVAETTSNLLEGEVVGEVGKEYSTKWFTFEVETMTTGTTYGDYTAEEGYTLVIAHITETNTSGGSQPFGTFDWFVDDGSFTYYIYPLDPIDGNDDMMPASFTLADGETASYDVVIEYPSDMENPHLVYVEQDEEGTTYTTFKLPIK